MAAFAKRNLDATCFDKNSPMLERSAGSSRIFRLAHIEPELVELAIRSQQIYQGWEEVSGAELIQRTGTVISGDQIADWGKAMAAAGASHMFVGSDSELLRLPTANVPSDLLVDTGGGVLQARRIADFLISLTRNSVRRARVCAIEQTGDSVRVFTASSAEIFDAVVICAGSATAMLAADVGIYVPIALAHHARFTFKLARGTPTLQCWITRSASGLSTYQHSSGPEEWAVGAHLPLDQTVWEVGVERAVERCREVTVGYVEESLELVDSTVIDEMHCTIAPETGDGFKVVRNGQVLAVHGENLFKLAPVIGELLADATVNGSIPSV
jgi:sarcosine oxidase